MMIYKTSLLKAIGPGLLYAGSAIGASHLIQSTRIGAEYGLTFLLLIAVALLLKYPFYLFGPKYFALTGNNLLHGYQQIGRWALWVFLIIASITFIPTIAILAYLTAHLISVSYPVISPQQALFIELIISIMLIVIGRYQAVDKVMKIVIVLLLISLLYAFFASVYHFPFFEKALWVSSEHIWHFADFVFILAVLGWMPAPLDSAILTSMWNEAKQERLGSVIPKRYIMIDFNIGYIATALLALLFLALGAMIIFDSGTVLSNENVAFTEQLIMLMTQYLGAWAKPVFALIASMVMFSTLLTVMDGLPRCYAGLLQLLFPKIKWSARTLSLILLAVMLSAALILIVNFFHSLLTLVDMTMLITFLTTPVLAYFNYQAVKIACAKSGERLSFWLKLLVYLGLLFLISFSVIFLLSLFYTR